MQDATLNQDQDKSANLDQDTAQDKARAKAKERDAAPKVAAPAPQVIQLDQILQTIESLSGNPAAILQVVTEGMRAGIISGADVRIIEMFLQGGLSGRPINPSAHASLAHTGAPLAQVKINEQLPAFMQAAGAQGAAFGDTVVIKPGILDEASGKGLPLLGHELKHVADHIAAGTLTAIHFDVGTSGGEQGAKAAAQATVKDAFSAEIAQIIELLKGHTSDADVTGVLRILSHWDSSTITQAWSTIGVEWREDLLDNLAPPHFKQFSRELLATYKNIPEAQRYQRVLQLTDEGFFNSVTEEEATQVLYLIQGLSPAYQAKFQAEDGGKRYTRFQRKLPGGAAATLSASVDPEKEKQLAAQTQQRREVAAEEKQAQAGTLSDEQRIKKLLSTSITDWAVTDADAKAVFDIFKGLGSDAAIGGMVRKLEADGLVETWLNNLPDAFAFAKANVSTLLSILKHRPPESALAQAEKLLSYGLFDWKVTDSEAILAYHLIRALPPSAQQTFRRRDEAQWFVRMEQNLSGDVIKGKVGAEGGYGLVDDHGDADKQKAAETERARDTQIIQAQESAIDALSAKVEKANDSTAPALLAELVGDGGEQCRAFTKHLDRLGLIQKLFSALGANAWTPANRRGALTVLQHRDPMHNIAMIRDVLSYGLFDWEVKSDEARIAYEMIRALPEAVRAEFTQTNPTWFERMDGNVSLELRESEDFGTYKGGDGDREGILAQLFEADIWTPAQSGRLRMVLQMVAQAGEKAAATPIVQEHWSAHNAPMFVELGFPQKGDAAPENVVDKTDTNTVKMVTQGIDALFKSEDIDGPMGDTMGVRGLQMSEVQEATGGHLSGIRFGEGTKDENDPEKQDKGEVDLSFDQEAGQVKFKAANLPVQSINVIQGNTTIRAGMGQMLGADIDLKWGTAVDPRTHLYVALQRLELKDLMIIRENQMFAVGSLALNDFLISGERVGPMPAAMDRAGALETVGNFIVGILKVIAGIIESLDDYVGDIAPLNPIFDPAKQDAGMAEQIRAAFSKDFNVNFKLGGLKVKDVVDSKGGHIQDAEVGTVKIDVILSQAAHARTQAQTLRDQAKSRGGEPTPAELTEIQRLEQQATDWDNKAHERQALQDQKASGALSADQTARLALLDRELSTIAIQGGIEGGLHLQGVNIAGVKADSLGADGVTIGGQVSGVNLGLNPADQLGSMANLEASANGQGESFDKQGTGVELKAESVNGQNISYSSTARRDQVLRDTIKGLEATQAPNADQTKALEAARAELTQIQPLVDEFLALDANIRALNSTQRARYIELRQLLSQAPTASVATVSATNVTAAADLGSNSVRVGADHLEAKDITAGDNHVDQVSASGVQASANLTEGKESASLSVASGQATGVKTAQGDVAQIDLSALGANVKRLDATTIRLDNFDLGLLSAQKVNVSAGGMTLRVDAQAALEGLHVAATAKLKADDKGNALPELQNLIVDVAQIKSIRGEGIAVDMPGTMGLTLKKGSIDDIALNQFDLSNNTFQSLGVGAAQVQGLVANVAGGIKANINNLKATSLTMSGVTAGTVKLSLADLSGDNVKVDMPGLGLEVKRFQGGAVQDLSFDQNSGQIDFPSISLASLNLAPMRFAASPRDLNLASLQTTDIKVEGTANLLTAAERKAKGLADDASGIESLHIKSLTMARAAVNGMNYNDSAAQQHVTMRSGFVNDLRVQNFDLNTNTLQVRTGSAGLQGLDAVIGQSLSAKGDINAQGLGFGLLSDDRMTVDLNNVTADMQVQMKEGNNINLIDLKTGDKGLSGSVTQQGLTTSVKNMTLGSLQLPRIAWTSGSKHITSAAPLTISDVAFDGSFQQAPAGSADALASAQIDRLHVGAVKFANLTYRDGSTSFSINEKMQKDMGLSISGIDLTSLHWAPNQAITGKVEVDKISGSQLAMALGADMQAGLDFSATDLNVAFNKNGDIVTSIADLDASIKGTASGAAFQANLQDLSTGDIIYGNNRVSIPNLTLAELSLPSISYKSPDYVVGLAPGAQGVKLSQISVNMTAHMRADGAGPERIEIHSVRVPTTTINGLKLDMPAQGVSIQLPTNQSGTIKDMFVQDFNLTPNGDSWAMDGAAGIGAISLPKVAASMKDSFSATTDINVGKIDLKMLKDGQGQTVDIASVRLANTQANLDGLGSFQITRGASAEGIHMSTDAAGNSDISVDQVSANGLIYDDGNMRVVIDSAALPKGFQMPANGEIKLPETAIKNSQFIIRDISKLTGGGASDQSSGGGLVDYNFLNTLNGKLNAYVDINWAPDIKNLEFAVNNGVFDFAKFEDSLPGLYDFALDFEMKGNELVLVADPFIKVAELSKWKLDDQEKALAKMGKIKMSSLVGDRVSAPADPATANDPITTPVHVAVKNIMGDFSMRGPSTINLGSMGKVKLGSQGLDGMLNFNVNGKLDSEGAGKLNLGMKALNLGLDGLNVAGMSVNSPDGGIRIQNVKDTQLTFNGLNPSSMRGTIEQAMASGITVKMPTKKPGA
jgi:hypothetical protein